MSKLNRDILYLTFKELQYDKNTLYSCLLVNKLWCENIIPILWKNPWRYLKRKGWKSMLIVILSHLSDELKNHLKNKGIRIIYKKKPLFDYISICRYLNLKGIDEITSIYNRDKKAAIKSEIFKLFINENTNYTHLYIPKHFDLQIHLFPGAKCCFSNLKFLYCSTSISNKVLIGLSELCNSIKELELSIESTKYKGDNYGIIKLIETPQNLYSIRFLSQYSLMRKPPPVYTKLENLMIKHANTIQYFKAANQHTKYLSSFVNLRRLELEYCTMIPDHLSLPFLQILNAKYIPVQVLTSLIENTCGHLTE